MPVVDGRIYWYATKRAPLGEDRAGPHVEADMSDLRERFGSWHVPIGSIIEATPPEAIIATGLYYRRPMGH